MVVGTPQLERALHSELHGDQVCDAEFSDFVFRAIISEHTSNNNNKTLLEIPTYLFLLVLALFYITILD